MESLANQKLAGTYHIFWNLLIIFKKYSSKFVKTQYVKKAFIFNDSNMVKSVINLEPYP